MSVDPAAMTDDALLDYIEALTGTIKAGADALVERLNAYEEARRRVPPIPHKLIAARAHVSTSAIINALKDKHEREAKAAKR